MEIQLKQRVIGAVVIFTLLIIFLPILFQDDSEQQYVEQILEPPSTQKVVHNNQDKNTTPDFMSDSLDNIVLEENAPKTDINEKVQIGRVQPIIADNSNTKSEQREKLNDPVSNIEDRAKFDSDLGAKFTAKISKSEQPLVDHKSVPEVKDFKVKSTVGKAAIDKQVYAVKLNDYSSKAQAMDAKQKLLSIGFPAYISKLNTSYGLYVGPELETRYIKALAKRITEETEFTPEIVVHNSGWKTE